jgi:CRP-like cAMP-binding protein
MSSSLFRYPTAQTSLEYSADVFSSLLSYKDRTYLIENGTVHHFEPGNVLCHQDCLEDQAFIILTGEMEVIEEIQEEKIVIGKLVSGDLVGEIGALFQLPRIASVVAKSPSAVLTIKPEHFWVLLNKTPILHSAVYQQLYERSLQAALCSSHKISKHSGDATDPDLSKFLRCWQVSTPN